MLQFNNDKLPASPASNQFSNHTGNFNVSSNIDQNIRNSSKSDTNINYTMNVHELDVSDVSHADVTVHTEFEQSMVYIVTKEEVENYKQP